MIAFNWRFRFLFFYFFVFSFAAAQEIEEASRAVWKISSEHFSGTGFFISQNLVLTNYHVIDGILKKSRLEDVTLTQKGNNKSFKLKKILALSNYYDLAVLEVDAFHPYFIDLIKSLAKPQKKKEYDRFLGLDRGESSAGLDKFDFLSDKESLHVFGYPHGVFKKINQFSVSFQKKSRLPFNPRETLTNPISYSDQDSFFSDVLVIRGASGSPVLNQKSQLKGVLSMAKDNLITFMTLDSLKDFILDENFLCGELSPKECLTLSREIFLDSVESGKYRNYFLIAQVYYTGRGVERNLDEAEKWFKKLAEKGHKQSQGFLGVMYYRGIGVEKNLDEAKKWFLEGAKQGDYVSTEYLAKMHFEGLGGEEDLILARMWFYKSANQGNLSSQKILAYMYHVGLGGERDYFRAKRWYESVAETGGAEAHYYLGLFYYLGLGVKRDLDLAVKWFTSSARLGEQKAQFKLYVMYSRGRGVEKNLDEAEKWLDKFKQNESKKTQIPLDSPKELVMQNSEKINFYGSCFQQFIKKDL